ncbi:MAG: YkgJ family cysteine cluster protein [Methanomicrobium sp.]|nr:YkgJ family cysteine cluster protein [Methanomicrobium sp.]
MAEFVCTLCGRCCMGMGRYVKITGRMSPEKYAVFHELSNEIFYPIVMRQYRDEFSLDERETPLEWCPFLLEKNSSGEYHCAVHDTIPSFCRKFKCYIYKIYNSDRNYAGEVKGKSTLVSKDESLKKIWDDDVMKYPIDNLSLWKKNMFSVLETKGYIVEEYD